MEDQPTCGKGLAEHSALPAKMAEVIAAMAANLEAHLPTIFTGDENGRSEHDAYVSLATAFREIADRLRETAAEMSAYRDLPMSQHIESAFADPAIFDAFETYVRLESELHEMLHDTLARDQAMLEQFGASE